MHEEITIPELTEVVARVTALLGPREGSVVQLEGGITNRNFRVKFGGTDYVVRLPGKRTKILGIDRTAECIANKAAAGLGMAPGVAAMFEEPSCLVTMFVNGREMTAEELRAPDVLSEVARDLRRFHDSGTELPTDFDSFRLVEEYAESGRANGSEPPEGYDDALAAAHTIEKAVRKLDDHQPIPAHNDLLTANFLRDSGGPIQLIDWEYAGMGDRWFDLGNFAVNNELDEAQEAALLAAYFESPASGRRLASLQLMRFMSDFREAMWGAVQSTISDLDFDFADYCAKHFERMRESADEGRLEALLEEAAGAAS